MILLGRVADAELPGLLAAADIFCYPSLCKGFGLPLLEAMAAGTATLAGASPAAPEVLGDAAELVDPTDVGALADGLRRLGLDADARRRLAKAGRARTRRFTWDRTAHLTVAAYERALG